MFEYSSRSLLDEWGLSRKEVDWILRHKKNSQGPLFGGAAELRLFQQWLDCDRISIIDAPADHDRSNKYDWLIRYGDRPVSIEVKSLKGNTVTRGTSLIKGRSEYYEGFVQCDASDCREVKLPSGRSIETTCLLEGEFDVLAVNLFEFDQEWTFAFALNSELPRSENYDFDGRSPLIKSQFSLTYPLTGDFHDNLFTVLDRAVDTSETETAFMPSPYGTEAPSSSNAIEIVDW